MPEFITLICDKCKKEYQIKRKIYNQRLRRGNPNYCKECMKAYQVETSKSTKANMADEQKSEYSKKLSEANKKYWANMDDNLKEARFDQLRKQNDEFQKSLTPEKLKELNDKRAKARANMSPDDIKRMRKNMSKSMTEHHANMSSEEKEIFSQQIKDGMNRMTEDERQEMKYAWVKWWNDLSDEERCNHNKKLNDDRDNWWANMSPEDKMNHVIPLMNGLHKWWDAMTPEERYAISKPKIEKCHAGHEKWWNLLTQEEKASIIRKTLSSAQGKNNLHKKFESRFNESHLSNTHYFKPEVVLYNGKVMHSWDYGIYDKTTNELVMVVDLDGAYYHGDNCDYDGIHSKEEYDERRGLSIPSDSNIKQFIIQEYNFSKCFELMLKILMMNYDEYVNYIFKMCRSMPFPHPKYTDTELVNSYNNLCRMKCDDKYHNAISLNTRIGDRIITHFHESIYYAHSNGNPSPYEAWYNDELLLKVIKNRIIYQAYLNPNKILQGFNISKVATKVSVFSAGRAKLLINKYLNEFDIIFDPFSGFSGRMLGTISSGKKYIGQDISKIHVKESNDIIKFLLDNGFDINAFVMQKDVLQSSGEYQCLFTCPPYSDKEQWLDVHADKRNCDDWIDICLSRFKCKRYLFVVDDTDRYKDYVIGDISNESHFGDNSEHIILIDQRSYIN